MTSSKLQLLPGRPEAEATRGSSLLIVVPGVGTPPIKKWNPDVHKPHWLHSIAAKDVSDATVLVWQHGLLPEQGFLLQHLEASATELLDVLVDKWFDEQEKCRPILFIAHSFGGIIVKQLMYLCDKGIDQARGVEVGDAVAGFVFMGTPHPKDNLESSQLLYRFYRVFADKLTQNSEPNEIGATGLARLSKDFKRVHQMTPMLTIYETQKTRLPSRLRAKKLMLLEKSLACIHAPHERQVQVDVSHVDLSCIRHRGPVYLALEDFITKAIDIGRKPFHQDTPQRRSSVHTITSRDDLRSLCAAVDLDSRSTIEPDIPSSRAIDEDNIAELHRLQFYYRLPHANSSYFERKKIFQSIEAVLLSSSRHELINQSNPSQIRTFSLCGNAGSGKTQIATRFVSVHRNRYDAIFWLPAQDATKLWTAYEEIAGELLLRTRLGARDISASRDLVRKWLSNCSKWLLVFDNVEDPEILRDFWPLGGSGHVLITSQRSLTMRMNYFGQDGMQIEALEKHRAVEFLRQMTRNSLRPDQTRHAAQLADSVGGLPLALVSVSHLINEGYLTFDGQEYERMYRKRESLIQSIRVQSIKTNETYDHVESVVFTQLESLRKGNSLMDVLSLLDPDRVEEAHLTKAARQIGLEGFPQNENAYHDARAELIRASLVIKSGDDLSMHRTIQELVIIRMGPNRFQKVFEAAVDMLSHLWPDASIVARHSISRWDECAGLLPHISRLNTIFEGVVSLDLSMDAKIRFAELLNNASWFMLERGQYKHAKSIIDQAELIGQSLDNAAQFHSDTKVVDVLSHIYYTYGALAQLMNLHEQSFTAHETLLRLRLKVQSGFPNNDPLLAHSYNELGSDSMRKKSYKQAEVFYLKSIETYQSLQDYTELMLALPAANLGLAYWLQGEHNQAAHVVGKAIEYRERQLGRDDIESMKTGRLLYAMGNIKSSQGLLEESLSFHERAYRQFTATVGPNHHRTCDVSCRVAIHYARLGRNDESIGLLDQALKVFIHRPFFKPETARVAFLKGQTLHKLGRVAEALPCAEKAIELYQELNPYSLKPVDSLAMTDFDELVMFWSR